MPRKPLTPEQREHHKAYMRAYFQRTRHTHDKKKLAVNAAKWYFKYRDRILAAQRAKRDLGQVEIIVAKDKPCADCGVSYPHYVMDFDHVRGKKLCNVSSGRFHRSMKRLLDEIAKCDVVCANYHRERTHLQNNYTKRKAA